MLSVIGRMFCYHGLHLSKKSSIAVFTVSSSPRKYLINLFLFLVSVIDSFIFHLKTFLFIWKRFNTIWSNWFSIFNNSNIPQTIQDFFFFRSHWLYLTSTRAILYIKDFISLFWASIDVMFDVNYIKWT